MKGCKIPRSSFYLYWRSHSGWARRMYQTNFQIRHDRHSRGGTDARCGWRLDALAVVIKRQVTTQRTSENRSSKPFSLRKCLKGMAGTTGLEPAASAVTA